ncbi:MAG TPA: AAA family ATPase [Thermoanaerobaculia bacterium]|nr:AAA family ATPase [Thermoanaerobaculia bacterium]
MDVPARDLAVLFRSRHPLVVCETVEETRFEGLVRGVAAELGLPVSTWSAASGLSPSHPTDAPRTADLSFALKLIRASRGDGVWLLKDPQAHLENAGALRALRETAQEFAGSARTIVLVGPLLPSKPELEDLEVRFEFALPGRDELRRLVAGLARRTTLENPTPRVTLSAAELESLVSDLEGLTMFEAERSLARAVVEDGMLDATDLPRIRRTKETLIGGGGILELIAAPEGFDRVGGLARLKKWVETRKAGFLASDGLLDPPRGLLLLGVQGCGKSLAAKAIAASWNVPLVSLEAGRLLAPYVGESERNLREALRRVERIAPCVLWIDEIEKAFVSARSAESDGGVSQRLLGALLTWMQERRRRVFLVATCNSVEELPPELMRKGRVDEVFFVDLPGAPARAEIFRLHLAKRGEEPPRFDLAKLGGASEGFSGAEIEQAVVSALYEARAAGLPLDGAALLVALRSTRPLSVVRAEEVAALRYWAAGRCVPAD